MWGELRGLPYEHTRVNNRKRGGKRSKAHLMGRCVQRLEHEGRMDGGGGGGRGRGEAGGSKTWSKEKGNCIVGERNGRKLLVKYTYTEREAPLMSNVFSRNI